MIIAQDRGESASRRPGLNAQKIISLSPSDGERDKGTTFREAVSMLGHQYSGGVGNSLGLLSLTE
jgi:hypothetical protein